MAQNETYLDKLSKNVFSPCKLQSLKNTGNKTKQNKNVEIESLTMEKKRPTLLISSSL